jgi:hypothetical protein
MQKEDIFGCRECNNEEARKKEQCLPVLKEFYFFYKYY